MPINYKEYHPKWSLISYLIRVVGAENKCEFCGAKNYKPHPTTGSKVVLTTAHLDHNINNNRFWNLKALCQRCHLSYDAKYHAENRKYGKNWKKNQLSLMQHSCISKFRLFYKSFFSCLFINNCGVSHY